MLFKLPEIAKFILMDWVGEYCTIVLSGSFDRALTSDVAQKSR